MASADPRSFNFPSVGLPEAIDRVRVLYGEAHRRRMSREEIAKLLGYNGLNGASVIIISNLAKYGLIEGRGDEIRVSDDAVTILVEPVGSPDRNAALRRTALRPDLFAELSEDLAASQLPGENAVRIRLERRGVPPKSAQSASRAFRETMALVAEQPGAYNQPQIAPEEDDRGGSMPEVQGAVGAAPPVPAARPPLAPSLLASSELPPVTFPLPRGNALEIRLRSKISRAEFERLQPILMGLLLMSVVEDEEGEGN